MTYFVHKPKRNTQRLLAVTLFAACAFTNWAVADWPTDPSWALVIGEAEGVTGPRISIVEGADGGVWVAWQDSLFDGAIRLQSVGIDGVVLSPNGIAVQEDPNLGNTSPPMLLRTADGVMVSRAQSSMSAYPVQRFDDDGSLLWADGFSVDDPIGLALGGAVELEDGDVLVVSYRASGMYLDRVDADGERVWADQSVIMPASGNSRIFGIVPDQVGGAYVFWDSFLSYRKLIFAMRVQADGTLAWESPVQMVLPLPDIASSRHSNPVAVSDGAGGAVVVWTEGHESGWQPAPQRVQRISADGSLSFGFDGVRVSLGTDRQFFVKVQTDPASNDLLIVWHDDFQEQMTINAQRLTVDGDRLWGDLGVEVAPIDPTFGSFDMLWHNNQLSMVIGGLTGAEIYNLDAQGQPATGPWAIREGTRVGDVRLARSGDGMIVTWQGDGPLNDDFVAMQRVNPNGRLGGRACSIADMNADGSLNFFDVSTFLGAFATDDLVADFTDDGMFNFFDVSAFLAAFDSGCP